MELLRHGVNAPGKLRIIIYALSEIQHFLGVRIGDGAGAAFRELKQKGFEQVGNDFTPVRITQGGFPSHELKEIMAVLGVPDLKGLVF